MKNNKPRTLNMRSFVSCKQIQQENKKNTKFNGYMYYQTCINNKQTYIHKKSNCTDTFTKAV